MRRQRGNVLGLPMGLLVLSVPMIVALLGYGLVTGHWASGGVFITVLGLSAYGLLWGLVGFFSEWSKRRATQLVLLLVVSAGLWFGLVAAEAPMEAILAAETVWCGVVLFFGGGMHLHA